MGLCEGGDAGFLRPGKPTDNAFIKAFNGRFRSECLNTHGFLTLADATEKIEAWIRYYLGSDATMRTGRTGPSATRPPISLQNPGGVASLPP